VGILNNATIPHINQFSGGTQALVWAPILYMVCLFLVFAMFSVPRGSLWIFVVDVRYVPTCAYSS
jgi:hypothetical protein